MFFLQVFEHLLRVFIPLCRSFLDPLASEFGILRHTVAIEVSESDKELSDTVPLFSCSQSPAKSGAGISSNASYRSLTPAYVLSPAERALCQTPVFGYAWGFSLIHPPRTPPLAAHAA